MSTVGKRVIYVGQAGSNGCHPQNLEGVAVAAHAPGTLLVNGATGFVASTKTAFDASQQALFADKDQQRSKSVDDAWIINENMVAIHGRSGDFLNALVATGQTIVQGDSLVSNAAGLLISATDTVDDGTNGSQVVIAYADETITTAATELVRVRIA